MIPEKVWMIWSIISLLTGNLIGRDHWYGFMIKKLNLKKKKKNRKPKSVDKFVDKGYIYNDESLTNDLSRW